MEDTSLQIRDMKPSYSDKSVAKTKGYSSYHRDWRIGRQEFWEKSSRTEQNKPRLQEKDRFKPQPCDYCGQTGFHTAGKDCSANANSAAIATDGTTSQQFVKAMPGTEAAKCREPATNIRSSLRRNSNQREIW